MPDVDVMGADDVMGAFFNALSRTNPNLSRQLQQRGRGRIPTPQLPGEPLNKASNIRAFMGLGLIATGGPAIWENTDGADKVLQAEPQESFEGKRLIISQSRSSGAAASLVTVRSLFIGSQPQSPVVDIGTPIEMFAPEATEAGLDLQIAYRANKVTLTLSLTAAPGSGESVTVSAGLYGNWIR